MVYIVITLSSILDGHANEIQAIKHAVAQLTARVTGSEAKMDV